MHCKNWVAEHVQHGSTAVRQLDNAVQTSARGLGRTRHLVSGALHSATCPSKGFAGSRPGKTDGAGAGDRFQTAVGAVPHWRVGGQRELEHVEKYRIPIFCTVPLSKVPSVPSK